MIVVMAALRWPSARPGLRLAISADDEVIEELACVRAFVYV